MCTAPRTLSLAILAVVLSGCGSESTGDVDAALVDAAVVFTDASRADATAAVDASVTIDAGPMCPAVSCPVAPAGYDLGDPMVAIDTCAFAMRDDDTWSSQQLVVDSLAASATVVTVADVLGDLNRTATSVPASALSTGTDVSNVVWSFAWNTGDNNVAYWIPQGLTGSTDASQSGTVDGKRVAMTTWYYDAASDPSSPGEKGVRISMADITNPADVSYRLLLLVEPYDDAGTPNYRAVNIHAGGVVWFGRCLYVADTSNGFRVFDMNQIMQVSTGSDTMGYDAISGNYYAHNYKYVVPQVGGYRRMSDCTPRFSFVALDRSTTPPSLISGEYNSSAADRRVFRWPLDPISGRLPSGTFYPREAFFMGYTHVQGAVAHDGAFYLSSSEPPAGRGSLVSASTSAAAVVAPWVDGPEDLVYDVTSDQLWGCGELVGKRYVFATTAP